MVHKAPTAQTQRSTYIRVNEATQQHSDTSTRAAESLMLILSRSSHHLDSLHKLQLYLVLKTQNLKAKHNPPGTAAFNT